MVRLNPRFHDIHCALLDFHAPLIVLWAGILGRTPTCEWEIAVLLRVKLSMQLHFLGRLQ
jgi:hypothetical protein